MANGTQTTNHPIKDSAETFPFKIIRLQKGGSQLAIRNRLKWNRPNFARLIAISERQLAKIESGEAASLATQRRINEVGRVIEALSNVIDEKAIGDWMQRPNSAFDGLKPLEVIERGESDRIWRMIFFLESGVAS